MIKKYSVAFDSIVYGLSSWNQQQSEKYDRFGAGRQEVELSIAAG